MTRPCLLCGSEDVVHVRSHTRGNVVERLLGRVDPDIRNTATCRECGSRAPISDRSRSTDDADTVAPVTVSAVTRSNPPVQGQIRPRGVAQPSAKVKGSGAGRQKGAGGRRSKRP